MAVQEFEIDAVGRTVCGKLDGGLNITATEPLLANPNPLACRKARRLAIAKGLAMIDCESLAVGQSHSHRLGLLCGQQCSEGH